MIPKLSSTKAWILSCIIGILFTYFYPAKSTSRIYINWIQLLWISITMNCYIYIWYFKSVEILFSYNIVKHYKHMMHIFWQCSLLEITLFVSEKFIYAEFFKSFIVISTIRLKDRKDKVEAYSITQLSYAIYLAPFKVILFTISLKFVMDCPICIILMNYGWQHILNSQ